MTKFVFLLSAIFIILSSCNHSNEVKPTNDTHVSEELSDTIQRKNLIVALKNIQQILLSQDKEKIADIFRFPFSAEVLGIYTDNETYEKLQSNGNQLTKAIFLEHYGKISESIWLNQLDNLFRHIPVDSLQYKNTLEYEAYIKTEPCYYSYQIEVVQGNVTLRLDMKSNKNYQSKTLSNDDIPENSSEMCEHTVLYIFQFDGTKLYFKKLLMAG